MKKHLLYPLSIIAFLSQINAQQRPVWTFGQGFQGWLNAASMEIPFLQNQETSDISIAYRNQWTGFPYAPRTAIVRGSHLTNRTECLNYLLGGSIVHDQIGAFSQTAFQPRLAFVFHDKIEPVKSGFSFGFNGSLNTTAFNGAALTFIQLPDEVGRQVLKGNHADLGFGAFAYRRLRKEAWTLYGGVSVQQLLSSRLAFNDRNRLLSFPQVLHGYGFIGAYYRPSRGYFEPSVWFQYVPNLPMQADFNMRYQFDKNFWLGLGYSTVRSFHSSVGVNTRKMRLHYAFDYPLSIAALNFTATHEFGLGFVFNNEKSKN